MKKLKYLLLIFIIFLTPNVFAQDFNVETSKITSPEGQGRTGTYSGLEIYNGGIPAVYNIGTRYNGRLSRIWFNLISGGYAGPDGFEKGHTYTLSMNMATQDWRNGFGSVSVKCDGSSGQELSNGRVTFVSMYKIKFSFTAPTDRYCQFVYIDLKSSNINSTYITGTSNWNLSSMVISDPAYSSGGGSGSGSGSGTTDPNQSVIDNANQNTQSIINNNNNNTTDIIDNANENAKATQDTINKGLQTCRDSYNIFNPLAHTGFYWATGLTGVDSTGAVSSDYIPFTSGDSIISNYYFYIFFYDSEKNFLGHSADLRFTAGVPYKSFSSFVPSVDSSSVRYIRLWFRSSVNNNLDMNTQDIMVNRGSTLYPYEPYGVDVCKSKLDETNSIINDTNSYLKDDSDPNISDSQFTNLFNSVGFNDPLGYLLQLPVQFINQLVSQSNTCQTISLGTLWGVALTLPCIDIGSIIGQQVWDIIDVLFSVGLLVVIFKNLYQTFANLMTMGGEKEAREKFSMPTPMEFLSIILGGDR